MDISFMNPCIGQNLNAANTDVNKNSDGRPEKADVPFRGGIGTHLRG